MKVTLEDILGKNDEKYIRILRLMHLMDGVNENIKNSKLVKSDLMFRQYQNLKKEYTKELLELLAEYDMPLQLAEAA